MSNPSGPRSGLWYYLPPIIWALAIFIASSYPTESLAPKEVLDYDKLIHVAVYCVLGFLVYRALTSANAPGWAFRHAGILTLAITALYGASDEFHQHFVPGRSMAFLDWVADAAGGLLAIALASVLLPRKTAE